MKTFKWIVRGLALGAGFLASQLPPGPLVTILSLAAAAAAGWTKDFPGTAPVDPPLNKQ